MSPEEQILVVHLFQGPPAGFDVIIVQSDIWIIEIHPERHTLSHLSPSLLIGPDTVAALLIEFRHPKGLNCLIAHQIQSLLNFDFNRQTMGIPATLAFDKVALHCLPPTYEIFVGSSNHVVNPGFAIGSGRTFKENEWLSVLP